MKFRLLIAALCLLALSGQAAASNPVTRETPSLHNWTTAVECDPTQLCAGCAVLAFVACKAAGTSVNSVDCLDGFPYCVCLWECNRASQVNRFLIPYEGEP